MIVRPLVPAPVTASASAAGRLPFAFGPRFFLLLAAGLVLTIPAWIDARALIALVVWNLLVLAIWIVDLRRIPSGPSLEVRRAWTTPLALGVTSRVAIELTNHSPLPIRVDVIDDVPPAIRRELPRGGLDAESGETASIEYEILPSERGDLAVGRVALRVRSAWSIAERWLSAGLQQTVRVFPDLADARRQSMFLLRSRQVALEKRRARVVGLGRDFESLREYQPGDEPRNICWTVTARRAKPVTKVYQPERSQAVWILVDGGRLLRARVGDRTKLDGLVNAALGLSEVALGAGDRVGLLTYGRRTHTRLAPGRGGQHLRAIVDALATVPAERAEADHAAAAAAVLAVQKQRALIVWLTDVAETSGVPDVIENAARLSPQHVVLFGVTKPTELTAIGQAVPSTEEEMYRMLAVQEMLDRRGVLLKGLRQRGVLVVELEPEAPTALLIDQYLSVKERNLI
ncbi:MAG TPA: DUF58 domain-containing protein [Vicinamibacterales bacterium]|nr:DUF58 domain-containing protein [Vicinamibacterales bacterium]